MPQYYPKSQIKTNLYTNGGEYILASTQEPYIGYYYKISTGQTFSGKTPEATLSIPIIPVSPQSNDSSLSPLSSNIILSEYTSIKPPSKLTKFIPHYDPTLPTTSDYKLGKFTRYFCKKSNELIYIEINKDTYTNLVKQNQEYLWQLYLPFEIPWQLTGNNQQVYDTNKNVTALISQRLRLFNFNLYLKEDYLKYYQ